MKIYQLTINEIEDLSSRIAISSSYQAKRFPKQATYYASKELALAKQKEIYDGISKLIGFFPNVEAVITEIEVIE